MTVCRWIGFCSVLVLIAVGCDNPSGLRPTLSGRVKLYDELGERISFAGNVQVSALSFSSVRKYETLTDASGRFEVRQPDEGPTPLRFAREGFGVMFLYDVGDGTGPLDVDIFAQSSADVTAASAEPEDCGSVTCLRLTLSVEGFFRSGTHRRFFRVYLSTEPDLAEWKYQATGLLVVPDDQPGLQQSGSDATFQLDGLQGLLDSFPSGATVHILVYGATENLASSYISPADGLEIFTDISRGSASTSFIMP